MKRGLKDGLQTFHPALFQDAGITPMKRGLKGAHRLPASTPGHPDAGITPMKRGLKGRFWLQVLASGADAGITPMKRGLKVYEIIVTNPSAESMQGLPR